jgi:hypothetical protein
MTRRRFIQQRDGELVEVTTDHEAEPRRHDGLLYNDRLFQDDGDPRYTSRKTHAEYMKRNNLSLHSDYTETWAKAAKERENIRSGHDTTRREQVARAMHEINNRRR